MEIRSGRPAGIGEYGKGTFKDATTGNINIPPAGMGETVAPAWGGAGDMNFLLKIVKKADSFD